MFLTLNEKASRFAGAIMIPSNQKVLRTIDISPIDNVVNELRQVNSTSSTGCLISRATAIGGLSREFFFWRSNSGNALDLQASSPFVVDSQGQHKPQPQS
jgi:hypothetical protein